MNQRPLILSELTTDEFSSLRSYINLVLIPSGSIRQHKTASPLGVDTMTAERFCHLASEYFFPTLLVAPPIYWGIFDKDLPESKQLYIDGNTATSIVSDVISSLHTHGLNNHLIINNYSPNDQLLDDAAKDLTKAITSLTVRSIALSQLRLSHQTTYRSDTIAANPKGHKQQQDASSDPISLDDIDATDDSQTSVSWLSTALDSLKDVIEVTYK